MPACPHLFLRAVRTARPVLLALLLTALLAPVSVLLSPRQALAADAGGAVLKEASRYAGTPYVYGATGPGSFDCSGFTRYVYGRFGVSLPHSSRGQYAAVKHIAKRDKVPGDLIFTYSSSGIYHVGIYSGKNTMWAAPKTGDVVRKQTIWTSAYVVGRPVTQRTRRHWIALGGARGQLGSAVTGERTAANGVRYSHYENGSVFYSPATGSHEVLGDLKRKWKQKGGRTGLLGLPVTDQRATSTGGARFSRFQHGAVYASAATGAHEIHGPIRTAWAAAGKASSRLGLPTTDVRALADGSGRYSRFQHGTIAYDTSTGRTTVSYS